MKVTKILQRFFPDEVETINITRVPKPGASGPSIMIFSKNGNGSKEMAVKFGVSRIPINVQLANRQKIAFFFDHRLVPVIDSITDGPEEEWAILMPAYKGNLHEATMGEQTFYNGELLKFWTSIVKEFVNLWQKSQIAWQECMEDQLARKPIPRIKKIEGVIKSLILPELGHSLGACWDIPIVVNNIEYPSMAETFFQMMNAYQPPKIAVLCHGDVNADNIMVSDDDWAIADWEWCGLHDWRLSASHMVGWWMSNSAIQEIKPSTSTEGQKLTLNYRFRLNQNIQKMIESAKTEFQNFALSVEEVNFDRQWKLMLAVLLFGEVRFLEARKVQPEIAIYLIGEAMKVWWD